MTETILVTGAGGQLGRAVVHHLLESEKVSPAHVIATTRHPEKLSALASRGVAVRSADFDDASSLERAFTGAQKVLIISTNELDLVGGKRLRQHAAAVEAAKRAGASHVAYTSMIAPERSALLFAADHLGTEEAIRASGLSHTLFRADAYQENLFLPLPTSLPAVIATGRWPTSAGEGRVAYAARDDMAAAIAGRLASSTTNSATITLAGSIAYSNAEVARLATKVTGRPIEIVPITDDALAELLRRVGVPDAFARTVASGDAHVRAGHSTPSDVLERLSRRKPRSLEAFLETNKAILVSAPAPAEPHPQSSMS